MKVRLPKFTLSAVLLSLLFFVVIAGGGLFLVASMRDMVFVNKGKELQQMLENTSIKLDAFINKEIALVLKMSTSPLIKEYILRPSATMYKDMVLKEIADYRASFTGNSIFWISDLDRMFYSDDNQAYWVDADDPVNYWYNMTLYKTDVYNFNINYNPDLKQIKLWINAPVFDNEHKSIGMVGTSIELSDFINTIYQGYANDAELYIFNNSGEITGAKDVNLVVNKIMLDKELKTVGAEILDRVKNRKRGETEYFISPEGVVAVGEIQSLGWHTTAIHSISIAAVLEMHSIQKILITIASVIFMIMSIVLLFFLKNYRNQSTTDELTKLNNRRDFMKTFQRRLFRYRSTDDWLCIALIDVDFFKNYNDHYGHQQGDECLRAIGIVLKSFESMGVYAARVGGEEFALIWYEKDAEHISQGSILRIQQGINNLQIPHEQSEVAKHVSVSIGICALRCGMSNDVRALYNLADKALYTAKNTGRNRTVVYNLSDNIDV
ncbi:MAG: diguanylate cyclase [Deltaproteobacteria bacterium]|jgi:diguanylate cyclase (GGDEF)-like protein|nr:diguanylate cyclase [Deltaproteobacteria bacterium]